jgi:hypothetical protein
MKEGRLVFRLLVNGRAQTDEQIDHLDVVVPTRGEQPSRGSAPLHEQLDQRWVPSAGHGEPNGVARVLIHDQPRLDIQPAFEQQLHDARGGRLGDAEVLTRR